MLASKYSRAHSYYEGKEGVWQSSKLFSDSDPHCISYSKGGKFQIKIQLNLLPSYSIRSQGDHLAFLIKIIFSFQMETSNLNLFIGIWYYVRWAPGFRALTSQLTFWRVSSWWVRIRPRTKLKKWRRLLYLSCSYRRLSLKYLTGNLEFNRQSHRSCIVLRIFTLIL